MSSKDEVVFSRTKYADNGLSLVLFLLLAAAAAALRWLAKQRSIERSRQFAGNGREGRSRLCDGIWLQVGGRRCEGSRECGSGGRRWWLMGWMSSRSSSGPGCGRQLSRCWWLTWSTVARVQVESKGGSEFCFGAAISFRFQARTANACINNKKRGSQRRRRRRWRSKQA